MSKTTFCALKISQVLSFLFSYLNSLQTHSGHYARGDTILCKKTKQMQMNTTQIDTDNSTLDDTRWSFTTKQNHACKQKGSFNPIKKFKTRLGTCTVLNVA